MTYDQIQRQTYVIIDDGGYVISDSAGRDRLFATQSEATLAAQEDAKLHSDARFIACIVARVDVENKPTIVTKQLW